MSMVFPSQSPMFRPPTSQGSLSPMGMAPAQPGALSQALAAEPAEPGTLSVLGGAETPGGAPSPYPPIQGTTVDIVFIDPLPEQYQCPVCDQVLRSPKKTACGHHYCSDCVEGLAQCKLCGAPVEAAKAKPDKALMRAIQALGVKCSWSENGCPWTDTLKNLQEHALGCDYRDVICEKGCGELYPKKFQERHFTEECGKREQRCEFCEKNIPKKTMAVHLKVCGAVPVNCPNQCGVQMIPKNELAAHLPMCPKKGCACPFSEFGCQYAGGTEVLQKHISAEPIRHLTFLCDGLIELKGFLGHMQNQVETMTRTLDDLQKKSEALEKLYGAQLVWRIDNFRQKQNEARSGARSTIFSQPFMSGRYGYKLLLNVCPYGDGPVRGQCFSVYITIMRGDFDSLLQWPFTHKITFTLLDQNPFAGQRQHKTYVVKPMESRENKVFLERPVSERNAAFGAQRFCDLETLDTYVQDDTIFLKVNVDTEMMSSL